MTAAAGGTKLAQRCASIILGILVGMVSCAFGASVKPGVDPDTQLPVDRSLWEAVTGTPSSWLDFILNIITPSSIKASDLCALNLDDPALPSLSDLAGALQRNPFSLKVVSDWAIAKLEYASFAANCICNASGGTYCTTTACTFSHPGVDFLNGVSALGTNSSYLQPNICSGYWTTTGATMAFPTNQHATRVTVEADSAMSGTIEGYTATSGETLLGSFTAGVAVSFTHSWPTADPKLTLVWRNATGTGGGAATIQVEFGPAGGEPACGTTTPPAPTEPTQPPLLVTPPDWTCATACDIMIRLQQLSDRLEWLRETVTLIQRQEVPFAYNVGTAHAGLTGSGTLTVQGLLGLRVHLTTVPAHWGLSSDNPQRYIPAPAEVAAGDTSGSQDTHFVHFVDELWFPEAMGAMTRVPYEFKPGVTGSITELLREP